MDIVNGIASVLTGGLTGLAGTVVSKIAEHKAKQLEIEDNQAKRVHEVEMRKVDAQLLQQEWAGRTQVAVAEAEGKASVGDAEAFSAALKSEPQRYSDGVKPDKGQGWVLVGLDAVRGLVRPLLTVYLCGITTVVYLQAHSLMTGAGMNLTGQQALDLEVRIVETILYLTSACVLFWFGTRAKGPGGKK